MRLLVIAQPQVLRYRSDLGAVVERHHHDAEKYHRRDGADPVVVDGRRPVLRSVGGLPEDLDGAQVRRDERQPRDPRRQRATGQEEVGRVRDGALEGEADADDEDEVDEQQERVDQAQIKVHSGGAVRLRQRRANSQPKLSECGDHNGLPRPRWLRSTEHGTDGWHRPLGGPFRSALEWLLRPPVTATGTAGGHQPPTATCSGVVIAAMTVPLAARSRRSSTSPRLRSRWSFHRVRSRTRAARTAGGATRPATPRLPSPRDSCKASQSTSIAGPTPSTSARASPGCRSRTACTTAPTRHAPARSSRSGYDRDDETLAAGGAGAGCDSGRTANHASCTQPSSTTLRAVPRTSSTSSSGRSRAATESYGWCRPRTKRATRCHGVRRDISRRRTRSPSFRSRELWEAQGCRGSGVLAMSSPFAGTGIIRGCSSAIAGSRSPRRCGEQRIYLTRR